MSVHVVATTHARRSEPFLDTVNSTVRGCESVFADGLYTISFEPDLSPAELALFNDIVATMRSGTGLSVVDYQAIRTQMQTLRAMRQLGRNAYVNLTEAERNRQTYDCLVAITEIFLKLTRET